MSAESYADRILKAREKMGFGQRRFARLLGLGVSCVQNWEHARRVPSGLYAQRLDQLLREIEDGHDPRS